MVRRKTCQAIIVTWLTLTVLSTLYYSYHIQYLDIGPISSYSCTGDSPRSKQCIVENFCIDRSGNIYIYFSFFLLSVFSLCIYNIRISNEYR